MLSKAMVSTCVFAMLMSVVTTFGALQKNRDQSLLSAMKSNDRALVYSLIELQANVNIRGKDRSTPLHWAAHHGCIDVMALLIGSGADINAQDKNGWTPLHLAVRQGKLEIVESLLEAEGIEINTQSTNLVEKSTRGYWWTQSTPLHIAVHEGFTQIAKALLAAGARSDVHNRFDQTPLIIAAEQGNATIVKLLVNEYRVDLEDKDNFGYTALNKAMGAGHIKVGQILIEAGAHTYTCSNGGWTPLHNTAYNGRFEAVEFLIQKKVHLNVQTHDNRTPLCMAQEKGHLRIVDLLQRKGARDSACECKQCKKERHEGCVIA